MSINKIGASELFVSQDDVEEAIQICKTDHQQAITQFEAFVLAKSNQGCVRHGSARTQNFYFLSVFFTNLTLLNYFIERMDKKCVNARDQDGETALFLLLEAKASAEKVIACTRLLLGAGIEKNARNGDIPAEWGRSLDMELDLDHFKGDSVLGVCVRDVICPIEEESSAATSKLLEILIEEGALCFVGNLELIDWRQTGEDAMEAALRTQYTSVLRNAEIEMNWSKIRWIYCALKSTASHFNHVPKDLAKKIAESIIFLPFGST